MNNAAKIIIRTGSAFIGVLLVIAVIIAYLHA